MATPGAIAVRRSIVVKRLEALRVKVISTKMAAEGKSQEEIDAYFIENRQKYSKDKEMAQVQMMENLADLMDTAYSVTPEAEMPEATPATSTKGYEEPPAVVEEAEAEQPADEPPAPSEPDAAPETEGKPKPPRRKRFGR